MLTATWLGVAILLFARLIAANVVLAQKLRNATEVSDASALALLQDCRRAMRMARVPALIVTDVVRSPAAAGIWRPRILLPPGLLDALSTGERRAILLHELAHLRCGDIVLNWLLGVLQIIHWFNPLLWLAFAQLKTDREGARDEMVLRLLCKNEGDSATRSYSRTLLKLVERIPGHSRSILGAAALTGIVDGSSQSLVPGLFGNRRGLTRRLETIARFTRDTGRLKWAGPTLFALLAGCTLTGAQSAHTVTRVYDIGDLLITIPDFDPMADEVKTDAFTMPASRPSAGPATAPEGHKIAATRQRRVDGFVNLIEDTVDPESWGDHGGSIRELQGKLIVTQTKENQDQIVKLIEQIRKRPGLQVNVQARYISCDEASAKALIAEWEKATPSARPIMGQPATTQWGATPVGLFLDDKQIEQFLRLSRNGAGNAVLAAPQLTLFNGQRAWVKVASQSDYVQGFALVKTADGQARYDPILGIAERGVLIDVAATVSADRKRVTLSLRPRVSALVGWSEAPWPSRPTGSNLIVSEPKIKVSELRTTVTIPDGRTLLLGGLEDPGIGAASQTQPAARPPGHLHALYLLVKPTIIDSEASEPRK